MECSAETASRDSGRISSANRNAPATLLSTTTWSTIEPSAFHASVAGTSESPRSLSRSGPPTSTVASPTVALTPKAGMDVKLRTGGTARERALPAATIARANGCSLSDSAAAARASTSSARQFSCVSMSLSVGAPLVRVPVLSNTTASTFRIDSRAKRSVINTPPRAARSVAIETTSGIAKPSACGQAITSTVMT